MESAIDIETKKLLELAGEDNVRVYADKSLRINMRHTDIKRGDLIIKFPGEEIVYPKAVAHLEFKAPNLPERLVAMLLKRVEVNAAKLAKEGKDHIVASFEFLNNVLANNNLLPCWSEFAEIKKVLKETDELKTFEKAGKLKIKLVHDKFFLNVEFVVPPEYPARKVEMKITGHNFEKTFAYIFESHCLEVIRRLWAGSDQGYDKPFDPNEGKIGYKKAKKGIAAELDKMQIATRAELKHDMDFMKKQAALKETIKTSKVDRKEFKLNIKHEKKYEAAQAKQAEEEAKAAAALEGLNQTTAKPQIYHAVNFLANYFVRYLPVAKCAMCGKKLVQSLKNGEKDSMVPERLYCGHWFHYKCVEEYVNTEPFKRICPVEGCKEIAHSNNFKSDDISVKHREKRWVQEQARIGEEDDLDRLFGI